MSKYSFQKLLASILLMLAYILGVGVLIAYDNFIAFFIILIASTLIISAWVKKIKARQRAEKIYHEELIREKARSDYLKNTVTRKEQI